MPKSVDVLIGSLQWGPLRYHLEPNDDATASIELDTTQTVGFDPQPLLESLQKVWHNIEQVGEGRWRGKISADEAQSLLADLVRMSSLGGAFKVSGEELTYFISGDVMSQALMQAQQEEGETLSGESSSANEVSDDVALPF